MSTCRCSIEIRAELARATAEIERAGRLYAAARAQVIVDVRSAGVRLGQAQQALEAWTTEIVPSLETEQRQAESAYQAGEIPLFNVLDVESPAGRWSHASARRRGRLVPRAHFARARHRPLLPIGAHS